MKVKLITLLVGYVFNSNPRLAISIPLRVIREEWAARYIAEHDGLYRVRVTWPR